MPMNKLLAIAVASLAGSAGAQAARGEYADPKVIEILSDKFTENDLQLIASRMARSLSESPYFASRTPPPRVVVGKIANRTNEAIDLESLADHIQVALFKTGRFELLDQKARLAIAQEYEYQQSGYVDPSQAKGPGRQLAADPIVTGTPASFTQQAGYDKLVYYKMSMTTSDLSMGALLCADDKDIRKKLKFVGISPQTSTRLKVAGHCTAALVRHRPDC